MPPMKIPSPIFSALAAVCVMGAALPQPTSAQVSTEDFDALKKMVEQMDGRVQKLEQTHEQDQKTHEQDQQVIRNCKSSWEKPKPPSPTPNRRPIMWPRCNRPIRSPAHRRGRCTTSPWWAMPRFSLAKPPGSTTLFNLPILRRFSCIEPAMTFSSKRDSTSCWPITRI